MTDRTNETSGRAQAQIGKHLAIVVIAVGLFAEAAVGTALVLPRPTVASSEALASIESAPLFRLRFAATAAFFKASAFADQVIETVAQAPDALFAHGQSAIDGLFTFELQTQGGDVSVAFLGLKWDLSGR